MEFTAEQKKNIYPFSPDTISRRMGFCLGNAFLCTMTAPWDDGVGDCGQALFFLEMEEETPQEIISPVDRLIVDDGCRKLIEHLHISDGDMLWHDISGTLRDFVAFFQAYMLNIGKPQVFATLHMEGMKKALKRLRHILYRRETAFAYEGMTGLPFALEGK